ncbi:MAG: sensor with HAMP domain protein [Aquifex sp.]|nr:MAG: sensor with HAMP domain protein [Aquifex sp.]
MNLIPKSIKGKVFIFVGTVATLSGLAVGIYTYNEEIEKAKTASREKVRLTLSFSKATREYVREVLRPKMYELLGKYTCIKEDFILEAQSSSFVTANIFHEVSGDFQGLRLRQVAFNPLNPQNTPTIIEERIIKLFKEKNLEEYTEIVSINNYRYLISAFPVKVDKSCLRCHGKIKDMPKAIRNLYKPKQDPNWKVGDIQGGIFIYEPYEATLLQARLDGILKGGFVFALNILIMGLVIFILNRYVFRPIDILKEHAEKISKGEIDEKIPIKTEDEIGELAKAFERMRVSIKKVMDILK